MISNTVIRLKTILFDSSKLFSLQSRNSPSGFKQPGLFSLQFAKNCYRKISKVAHNIIAYRRIWVFIALILIADDHWSAAAEIRDCVAAFVDNTAITMSELDEAYTKAFQLTPGITRGEVLNTMINRVLLLREAKKMGLEASSEDELIKEYTDLKIKAFIRIKEEELTDFYEKHLSDFQGKEFEAVRDEIENYLTEKEVNQRLKSQINELRGKAYIKIQLNRDREGN